MAVIKGDVGELGIVCVWLQAYDLVRSVYRNAAFLSSLVNYPLGDVLGDAVDVVVLGILG